MAEAPSLPVYSEHVFHSTIDHYNFRPTVPTTTFPLRYFVNNDYYDDEKGGPCFFYAGNEADILQFVNNSGFLLEAAREFHALVVFCEHRYYGTSNPFGSNEYALGVPYNISFLTVEQAMADYNLLNLRLRHEYNTTATVVFGGSYGANLAMWLRLKNPNLWAGAIASSATPLKHLLRNSNSFARIVTQVYANVSSACPDWIRQGWKELYTDCQTVHGRVRIARELCLCHALPDQSAADDVHGWISGALETMVQYGYPYPTEFYNPLPAYPFAVACQDMLKTNQTGLGAFYAAANVYYNYTGQAGNCFDFQESVLTQSAQYWYRTGQVHRLAAQRQRTAKRRARDAHSTQNDDDDYSEVTWKETNRAWGYQTCTEAYQPMPTNGKTDFEIPYVPNQTEYFQECSRRWGVQPRPNWEEITFMGADIGAGSNIFLTCGQLDPWRAAGIQTLPEGAPDSIVVRIIEGGAHHLDLRASNELDPPSVRQVRQEEKDAIRKWIIKWNTIHQNSEGDEDVLHSATSEL